MFMKNLLQVSLFIKEWYEILPKQISTCIKTFMTQKHRLKSSIETTVNLIKTTNKK